MNTPANNFSLSKETLTEHREHLVKRIKRVKRENLAHWGFFYVMLGFILVDAFGIAKLSTITLIVLGATLPVVVAVAKGAAVYLYSTQRYLEEVDALLERELR